MESWNVAKFSSIQSNKHAQKWLFTKLLFSFLHLAQLRLPKNQTEYNSRRKGSLIFTSGRARRQSWNPLTVNYCVWGTEALGNFFQNDFILPPFLTLKTTLPILTELQPHFHCHQIQMKGSGKNIQVHILLRSFCCIRSHHSHWNETIKVLCI